MRVLALLLPLLLLQDDPCKGWVHPWAGAPVGAKLTWKVTTWIPDFAAGKADAFEEFSLRRIETVKEVSKERVVVSRAEGTEEPNPQEYFVGLPAELEGKFAKAGEEELKVGGKAWPCTIHERKVDVQAGVTQVTRIWKAAAFPTWAVRHSWTMNMKGRESGWVEEAVELGAVVKVADKDFPCTVIRRSTRSGGVETVESTWWTDAIPGRAAKRTRQHLMEGRELKANGALEELVSFDAGK